MRRVARLLPYMALLVVVALAVGLVWRAGPLRQHLRKTIASELSRQLDREVAIGDLSLSPFGRVVLHDVEVKKKGGAILLRAPEATVRLRRPKSLGSLSSAATAVRGITLVRPEITVVRGADKRWDVEDLLRREPTKPSRFTGDVVIQKGRLKIVDQALGGVTTDLDNLDITLRQPGSGQTIFSVRAQGKADGFDALEVRGRSDSEAGTAEASGSVTSLDVDYALARLPKMQAFTVSGGRADIKGEYARAGGSPQNPADGLTVEGEVKDSGISFPWLRRPITSVSGKVRFADDVVHLEGMEGLLSGAPIKAEGTVSGMKSPELAIDLSATGLRYEQLKTLVPKLYVPATLVMPAPLRITMRIEGPASEVGVSGKAEMRVLRFRLIPWNDLVATFTYTNGHLKIRGLRAHGSPRQIEADVDVMWGPGTAAGAEATFSLTKVPADVLAQMLGLTVEDVGGTVSVTGTAGMREGHQCLDGRFAVEGAAVRGVQLGRISGDVEYAGGVVTVSRARLEGPAATGDISGKVVLPDAFSFEAELASVDVAALGTIIRRPGLRGRFPASARGSGSLREASAEGTLKIGPGQLQGRAFESAGAKFAVSRERVRVSEAMVSLPRGRCEGELEVRGWRRGAEAAGLSGRVSFAEVSPPDWLPPAYGALITGGTLDGSAEVRGSVGAPEVEMDLRANSVTTAGLILPLAVWERYQGAAMWLSDVSLAESPRPLGITGGAHVSYKGGVVTVDRVDLTETRTGLRVAGSVRPDDLSLKVSGDRVELRLLAATLRQRWGLDIRGDAQIEATIAGSVTDPRVGFALRAPRATVNEMPFHDIALVGELRDGVLVVDEETQVNQGDSRVRAAGSLGLKPPASDRALMIEVEGISVSRLQMLVDSAIYRLSRSGVHVRGTEKYVAARMPVGGALSAQARITGSAAEPTAHVGLKLDRLAFGGRQIDSIGGDLTFFLQTGGGRMVGLRRLEIAELQAKSGDTTVVIGGPLPLGAGQPGAGGRAPGWVSADGEMSLTVQIFNLDLRLLAPWLQYLAELKGHVGPSPPAAEEDGTGTAAEEEDETAAEEEKMPPPLSREELIKLAQARARPSPNGDGFSGDATINLDITGFLPQPRLEGDAHIEQLRIGPIEFETADALPIRLESGRLTIDDLSFRNAQVDAHGQVAIDILGLAATAAGEPEAPGAPAAATGAPAAATGASVAAPGGTFSVAGYVDFGGSPGGGDGGNRVNIEAELSDIDVGVPGMIDGQLAGKVRLTNVASDSLTLETPSGGPLVLSHATLSIPREGFPPSQGGGLAFGPTAKLRLETGEEVEFVYGTGSRPTRIALDPGGYLNVGGPLTAAGLTLEGRVSSSQGTLSFPNGTLTLRSGSAGIVREAGRPPRVWVSGEADGRVGEYYISMSPAGQVYPRADEGAADGEASFAPPLPLNAISIPPLSQSYILALLTGPMLAPARGRGEDINYLLANPNGSGGAGGSITGLALSPLGSASGLQRLSLDVALQGTMKLNIGERLFERVIVSYASPLSGPPEGRTLSITYEVTPRWSVGPSFSDLYPTRWDVQALIPF